MRNTASKRAIDRVNITRGDKRNAKTPSLYAKNAAVKLSGNGKYPSPLDPHRDCYRLFTPEFGHVNNQQHKVKIRNYIKPRSYKLRRLPLTIHDQVYAEIDRLWKKVVIEKDQVSSGFFRLY